MLSGRQTGILALVSVFMWILATLYVRLFPGLLLDPVRGGFSFLTTILVAWLSIRLIRRSARLAPGRLLAGVSVVGTIAMMTDGLVLHWAPGFYGTDDTVIRLGAAWLLWGYGLSLGIALLMSRKPALSG